MKRDLSLSAPTPIIAAALRRRPRARANGGGKPRIHENNYRAEGGATRGKPLRKAGAKPGNLNAVALPHKTPEDIAFYRRSTAVLHEARALVRAVNRALRESKMQCS